MLTINSIYGKIKEKVKICIVQNAILGGRKMKNLIRMITMLLAISVLFVLPYYAIASDENVIQTESIDEILVLQEVEKLKMVNIDEIEYLPETEIYFNEEKVELTVPVFAYDSNIFIGFRDLFENMEMTVDFNFYDYPSSNGGETEIISVREVYATGRLNGYDIKYTIDIVNGKLSYSYADSISTVSKSDMRYYPVIIEGRTYISLLDAPVKKGYGEIPPEKITVYYSIENDDRRQYPDDRSQW